MYVMPSFIQACFETLIPGNPEYPYYHERSIEGIIKDSALRQGFKNRVAAQVNRTNTINGRPYKEDPTIIAWIVCHEPISAPFNYPNGVPQITLEELTDWFRETAPQGLYSETSRARDRSRCQRSWSSRTADYH